MTPARVSLYPLSSGHHVAILSEDGAVFEARTFGNPFHAAQWATSWALPIYCEDNYDAVAECLEELSAIDRYSRD